MVLVLPCLANPFRFHFGENLECRQCKPGKNHAAGELEFCILGRPGERRGIMPAVFLIKKDSARTEIWRDRDRGLYPWKLEIAELDGDPEPEIAIGVYKRTRHDGNLARRLFIYDWTGFCMFPKWLGSRLALPMEDFKFTKSDPDGIHRLFTIEHGAKGKLIRQYRWNGFGFTGEQVVKRIGPKGDEAELCEFFSNL